MTITISKLHRNIQCKMRPVRGSNVLRPTFGGPRQPFNRMGDHWAMDVDYGSLRPDDARALLAQLIMAGNEPIAMPIPADSVATASGTPRVNGAGQAGSLLVADGFTSGSTVTTGLFTITTGGRRYVHMVTADTVMTGGGGTLPIWPMLRVSPSDNAVLTFNAVLIEGFVDEAVQWAAGGRAGVRPDPFTIEEVE